MPGAEPTKFMTTPEVSEEYRIPEATLRYWRHRGIGPRSFRMGPRRVLYERSEVEAWVEEQRANGAA